MIRQSVDKEVDTFKFRKAAYQETFLDQSPLNMSNE